ncbi:MAG: hypothetical protein KJN97_00300 [Deltaproteobacteria bacterium]|nr:hypothetical protein [Deltaproteobacteria bacterium]
MSTVAALALILTTMSLIVHFAMLAMGKLRTQNLEIITGVFDGMPMSLEDRRMALIMGPTWIYVNMAILNAFFAMAMWAVAVHVERTDVRWIAYAALVFHGVAALNWLGNLVIGTSYVLRKLREQESDGRR